MIFWNLRSKSLNGAFWSRTFSGWRKLLNLRAGDGDRTRDVQLGKLAVVAALIQNKALVDVQAEPRRTSADSQHLHRVLPFVEGGDGVDVQIHSKSVAELIGDELRINTGLPRKTGMRASHDLKRCPFELDGFQPRRNEPTPGIVAPEWSG